MIYNRIGAVCRFDGSEYRVGDMVVATAESPWEGLYGTITEICDGDDRQTENGTIDLYCEFLPPIHPAEICKLEKQFTSWFGHEKKLDEIDFDSVIMSPEMVRIIGRKNDTRKVTVYLVREEWALDYNGGMGTHLFMDPDEAKMAMLRMIHEDMTDGCIHSWADRGDLDFEIKEDSYEYWLHDSYHENHYLITLEARDLYITDATFQLLGSIFADEGRRNDLAAQIEDWEELEDLTEDEYLKFITDPGIPEKIQTHLSKNDSYWESYWESISECAFQMLREYRKQIGKADCFVPEPNSLYPLCVGKGSKECLKCCLYKDMQSEGGL